MALSPAPAPTAPSVRQQSVQQSSAPVRELAVNMPLQSLASSRVLVVVTSTISGGARSHIPSLPIWDQVKLSGTGGYVRLGDLLVSAWWSKPGTLVYQAGMFRFGGMIGLAPEYATALAMELQECRSGSILALSQSWSESILQAVTAQAPAVGQSVRGVLAVGIAEGQHHFTTPEDGRKILTQTSASGFFAAPFSVAGTYKTQDSNDPLDVEIPFDGSPSAAGILLFNVVSGLNDIDSLEAEVFTNAFLSLAGATMTTASWLSPGGEVDHDADSYLEFESMTSQSSTNAVLFGALTVTISTDAPLFAIHSVSHDADAYLDQYFVVEEIVEVEILGPAEAGHPTNVVIVFGQEFDHTTDAYILEDDRHQTDAYVFAGQSFHTTDTQLIATVNLTHTTTGYLVSLGEEDYTVDSYVQAIEPPSEDHTGDTSIVGDNIISMTGWELRDPNLECSIYSPNYSTSTPLSVTTSAKRPGSQGAYGLRIDSTLGAGSDAYWLPAHNAKSLTDSDSADNENNVAQTQHRELWASTWFRCNNLPSASLEQLISDVSVSAVLPGSGSPVIAESFGVTIGNGGTSGIIGLYWGNRITLGSYPFSDTNWHKLEVRCVSGNLNPLSMASSANPFTIEVYLDGVLIISGLSAMSCGGGGPVLGIQKKLGTTHYQVDFDDFTISTNRLFQYDLSVIAKPAQDDGNYSTWASTPGGDYTDVASIPYDVAKHKDSSASGQKTTVKVYSGGDTDPYPGVIHAVGVSAVMQFNTNSGNQNIGLMVREGGTDLQLKAYHPTSTGGRAYHDFTVLCSYSPVASEVWADAIYDFEIGVAQLVDNGANRIVLLAANLLVSPFSYSNTTDADLYGSDTETHTTTSVLARLAQHTTDAYITGQGMPHTTDSLIVSNQSLTHATDTTLSGSPEGTHSADAFIDRSLDQTTDAAIVDQRGSVHAADSLLLGVVESYHDADSVIGALVDKPHDADALIHRLIEDFHTSDAARLLTGNAAHTTNSRQIGAISATHTTTAVKRAAITATMTTDARSYLQRLNTHNTSAAVLGTNDRSHSTSSAMQPTNVVAILHTTAPGIRATFSLAATSNAFIKVGRTGTHTADSDLFGTLQTTHGTNARLVMAVERSFTHLTNADLKGASSLNVSTDTRLKITTTADCDTDSFLRLMPELSQTANAVLKIVQERYQSANSVLKLTGSQTNTVDVLLKITTETDHDSDSILAGTVTISGTTNSHLYGEVNNPHTSTALLRKQMDLTHTVDARLASELMYSSDAKLGIPAEKFQVSSSSLFGSSTTTQTVDVGILKTGSLTHTSNAGMLATLDGVFTTSAAKLGVSTVQSSTDAAAAFELLHSGDTTTAGTASAQGTSNAFLVNDEQGIFEVEPPDPDLNTMFPGAF